MKDKGQEQKTAEEILDKIVRNDKDHFAATTYEEDGAGGSSRYTRNDLVLKAMEEYRRLSSSQGILTGPDAERFLKNMENPKKVSEEERQQIKTSFEKIEAISKVESSLKCTHIIDLINRYWGFDDNQKHTHTWHDKQDCIEAIRRLSSKEDQGWVSVKEMLPEENVSVLVFIPEEDDHITTGMWDVSKKWVLLDEYRVPRSEVTYWRPMVDAPQDKSYTKSPYRYTEEDTMSNQIRALQKKIFDLEHPRPESEQI